MELFPKVAMIIRDPAHAVRIAVSKPLRMEETFKDVLSELIGPGRQERSASACGSSGAPIPDLTHSDKWKAMLMAIQKAWRGCPQSRGDAVKVALRHLSFAFQRWGSMADPIAKSALLLPICVLLAYVNSDSCELPNRRAHAAALVGSFMPRFLTAWGVCADWGLVSTAFLRLFDSCYHDIASSAEQAEEHLNLVDEMFVKERVLSTHGSGSAEEGGRLITDHMHRQMQKRLLYVLSGRVCRLGGRCSANEPDDMLVKNI